MLGDGLGPGKLRSKFRRRKGFGSSQTVESQDTERRIATLATRLDSYLENPQTSDWHRSLDTAAFMHEMKVLKAELMTINNATHGASRLGAAQAKNQASTSTSDGPEGKRSRSTIAGEHGGDGKKGSLENEKCKEGEQAENEPDQKKNGQTNTAGSASACLNPDANVIATRKSSRSHSISNSGASRASAGAAPTKSYAEARHQLRVQTLVLAAGRGLDLDDKSSKDPASVLIAASAIVATALPAQFAGMRDFFQQELSSVLQLGADADDSPASSEFGGDGVQRSTGLQQLGGRGGVGNDDKDRERLTEQEEKDRAAREKVEQEKKRAARETKRLQRVGVLGQMLSVCAEGSNESPSRTASLAASARTLLDAAGSVVTSSRRPSVPDAHAVLSSMAANSLSVSSRTVGAPASQTPAGSASSRVTLQTITASGTPSQITSAHTTPNVQGDQSVVTSNVPLKPQATDSFASMVLATGAAAGGAPMATGNQQQQFGAMTQFGAGHQNAMANAGASASASAFSSINVAHPSTGLGTVGGFGSTLGTGTVDQFNSLALDSARDTFELSRAGSKTNDTSTVHLVSPHRPGFVDETLVFDGNHSDFPLNLPSNSILEQIIRAYADSASPRHGHSFSVGMISPRNVQSGVVVGDLGNTKAFHPVVSHGHANLDATVFRKTPGTSGNPALPWQHSLDGGHEVPHSKSLNFPPGSILPAAAEGTSKQGKVALYPPGTAGGGKMMYGYLMQKMHKSDFKKGRKKFPRLKSADTEQQQRGESSAAGLDSGRLSVLSNAAPSTNANSVGDASVVTLEKRRDDLNQYRTPNKPVGAFPGLTSASQSANPSPSRANSGQAAGSSGVAGPFGFQSQTTLGPSGSCHPEQQKLPTLLEVHEDLSNRGGSRFGSDVEGNARDKDAGKGLVKMSLNAPPTFGRPLPRAVGTDIGAGTGTGPGMGAHTGVGPMKDKDSGATEVLNNKNEVGNEKQLGTVGREFGKSRPGNAVTPATSGVPAASAEQKVVASDNVTIAASNTPTQQDPGKSQMGDISGKTNAGATVAAATLSLQTTQKVSQGEGGATRSTKRGEEVGAQANKGQASAGKDKHRSNKKSESAGKEGKPKSNAKDAEAAKQKAKLIGIQKDGVGQHKKGGSACTSI